MVFWQLTVDANDPALLARFWARALSYRPVPPAEPQTTRQAHYRARLGEQAAFDDWIFDPAGLGPPIWFQEVPETKAGKNRLHMDLYPTGRDMALPLERRIEIVEATVAEHAGLGASVERRTRHDDPMTRCTNVGTLLAFTSDCSRTPGRPGHAGRLRKKQNWIGGSEYNPCSEAFIPSPPELIPYPS